MDSLVLVTNDQKCWKTESCELDGLTPLWGSVVTIIIIVTAGIELNLFLLPSFKIHTQGQKPEFLSKTMWGKNWIWYPVQCHLQKQIFSPLQMSSQHGCPHWNKELINAFGGSNYGWCKIIGERFLPNCSIYAVPRIFHTPPLALNCDG